MHKVLGGLFFCFLGCYLMLCGIFVIVDDLLKKKKKETKILCLAIV